jgi:oxalate decarboxylase/phosphoglucose isomerase-like protein (cupin superfamily)
VLSRKTTSMMRKTLLSFWGLWCVIALVQSAFARPQAGTIQELLEAPASQYVENIFVDGVVALSTAAGSVQAYEGTRNPLLNSVGSAALYFTLKKCAILEPHVHTNTPEFYFVISGTGTFSLWSSNGSVVHLKTPITNGSFMIIPAGWPHMITGPETSSTPLVLLANYLSGLPQVYFLASRASVFEQTSPSVMASVFNVSTAEYSTFFGAESGVGIVFNSSCLAS